MNQATGWVRSLAVSIILLSLGTPVVGQGSSFVNFETAPVHPVALSADGRTLAVCNLPDGRVDLFDLTRGVPRPVGSVHTGVDPITARFNPNGELWVVNHISDSISIIDPARRVVIATLDCFDGPADIVFTRGGTRAFVSHAGANVVEIWDTAARTSVGSVDLDGDRPKAMAVSLDESELYIAIQESGNASTIIAPAFTGLERTPQPSAADLPDGPNSGRNPAPNSGDVFSPEINPKIPSANAPPRGGLIVKKQNGRWLDDNRGDWTEYVSGTNAHLTGRIPGWDIADHDLAIMNTSNGAVRYVRGLMNICFDVAVNPASGKVAVIGTDGINEVRFEPVLQSIFNRVRLALVDPREPTATITDLNPHLDYRTRSLPMVQRRQSAGDPRGIAWNSRGTRGYITGMGSNNILMIDRDGNRIGQAMTLPDGPTGLVLDELRNRIYVFCRFASRLVSLDAESLAIIHVIPLHDSTPVAVRAGRKHFYDTTANSGLGQAACASCHIDGRFDRLAWDLGDPAGEMLDLLTRNFTVVPASTNSFHPMKGAMVTQTLQDIVGHEPFHWRGDRDGIEQFNITFPALQGRDEELTATEMQEFEDFLATITFPPNPHRNLDNSLPAALPLFFERSLGRGNVRAGERFPPGDARRGMNDFRSSIGAGCLACHTLPSGLGPDAQFRNFRWETFGPGPNGERHIGMVAMERSSGLPFKIQHLRNLFDRIGFDLKSNSSRAGFGFLHDGRVDSLTRFLQDGFDLREDQQTADMIAFLMAFTGSDLPGGVVTDVNRPPGPPSRDVPAGVGFQTSLTSSASNARVDFMISLARRVGSRVELVVHGSRDGAARSWLMRGLEFLADKANEINAEIEVLAFARADTPLTFTLVPLGTGQRLALDRDGDGFFNQSEIEIGSDPADPAVTPATTTPRLTSFSFGAGKVELEWFGRFGSGYRVQIRDMIAPESQWSDLGERIVLSSNPANFMDQIDFQRSARFYRIIHVP